MRRSAPVSRRDVRRLVESESLGAAMFETLARLEPHAERAAVWSTLGHLERLTQSGIDALIRRADIGGPTTNRLAAGAGHGGATALALLPWRAKLRIVLVGTGRYLPTFRRLQADHRTGEHADLFSFVLDHELAIVELTESGLHDGHPRADSVRRLLDDERIERYRRG